MSDWETVIGLEVHVQLKTASKIFSGAATDYGSEPNTQACAVDIALPGVLPVMNQEAARMAVVFGLAIGAKINQRSIFARKNYFYPDLPKGYQISQYELPIVAEGQLEINVDGQLRSIGITRAHLEEDAGKSVHEGFHGATGIDLNRAGTPLLEIVSEPDLRTSAEAVAYLKKLHSLVRYLGICDGNMQEGSFRCDANISVKPRSTSTLGTRAEIKNINSFRFVERAITFEIERQIDLLEEGGSVIQETRLYDADRDETRSMRGKEEAHDYRYFPDPDLPPLLLSDQFLDQVAASLPELPEARCARFVSEYKLDPSEATKLVDDRAVADFFEATVKDSPKEAKRVANWINGEIAARLNRQNLTISDSPVTPDLLSKLIQRIADGTLSGNTAKEVFSALWEGERDVDQVIDDKGLKQITDSGAIESIVDEVLNGFVDQVEQYKSGNTKVFGFLVGQVMKRSQGKANPKQVNELLRNKLG
ncbi:MAG TPA: Asp-tRNA(Asn)/Glu-tRNA(Gln) amidotransferase subunit GatB [Arenicellales bacterium]|nr:Asp-tRNA(Asn)/Glu-tRNA(Gln) amidotransferase subunit GatB [Arenicellales bacterium]